jgi:hypothetical protein
MILCFGVAHDGL